jgi:O-antigen/teichoic acid export membrane protein
VLSALASLAARGIGILTVLVTVPLTIHYLGTERYGLWITISSVSAVLAFADLGLGSGLVNAVSEAHGRNDTATATQYTASAFFILSAIVATLGVVFVVAYPLISWGRVFNINSQLALAEAGPAMIIFVVCFLVTVPLGISDAILSAHQESFLRTVWEATGNLLGLAGVLLAVYLKAGLPWLVLATSGAPVLARATNATILFAIRRPALLPRWRNVERKAARHVLRLGLLFFVLQLTASLGWGVDNLILTQILGPGAVAEYSSTRRLFVIPMMLGMMLQPLWPAYCEAIARVDLRWVRTTLLRSVMLTALLSSVSCGLLVIFGRPIMRLWVGSAIYPSWLLLIALGVSTMFGQIGGAGHALLNGASAMRFQAITGVLMACANLPASIFLTRHIGVSGVAWGTVLSAAVFLWLPMAIYIPILLKRFRKQATPVVDKGTA